MFEDVPAGQLTPELVDALKAQGFEQLTPIQLGVLDPDLASRDLRLSSETGSGKTVALGLVLARALVADPEGKGTRALVMAPTRELAQQVARELTWLLRAHRLHVAVVTGGAPYGPEERSLRRGPAVVVATPGRFADHLERGNVSLDSVGTLILDEADQLLDQGFREELDAVRAALPEGARVHLVSATFGDDVVQLADRYQQDAAQVQGTQLGAANPRIRHTVHVVPPHDKGPALVNTLLMDPRARTMVFVPTRALTAEVAGKLCDRGFLAGAISGDLSQPERERRLSAFRSGAAPILVATDVAARGIDVPGVTRVIQWGTPIDPEMYTHRSGRTGRAGAEGQSISLIAPGERFRLRRCLQLAGVKAEFEDIPTAPAIRTASEERLCTSLSEGEAAPAEARALAERLLAEHDDPAELVSRLLQRTDLSGPCEPMDVRAVRAPKHDRGADRGQDRRQEGPRGQRPRRRGQDGDYVTMQLSWGGRSGANPRRVLALVCRRGDIRSSQIGAVDIRPASSLVQVAAPAAERVLAGFAKPDDRDGHIRIRPHQPPRKKRQA